MGDRIHFARSVFTGIAAILAAFPAMAETIPVDGVYSARVSLPPDVQLILIDRFEGDLGQDAELALTDRLGRAVVRGEPYFDLINPAALRGAVVEVEGNDGTVTSSPLVPDAELRGTVRSELIDRDVEPKIERECVKRDQDDKCTERRQIRIQCSELSVRVDPRILLIGAGGEQLYSYTSPRTQAERYCADENSVPSGLEMANSLIDQIADDIRADLAPVQSRRAIRVMERRRDLRRDDRDAFRAAVRATNESIEAACRGFEALEATNPDHVSVLYNIGLCFESGGELDRALEYYSRALSIDPGRDYPIDGQRRLRSRIRAEEDLAQRAEF